MPKKDPRIDAYIIQAAEFARPILEHLRALVHKACPDAVETIKWGAPHFDHNGSILCFMAAFKQHCVFGFRKAPLMKDPHKLLSDAGDSGMGHFGRITSLKDLPSSKVLLSYIKEAAKLNEDGVKLAVKKKTADEIEVPADLKKALSKSKEAKKVFDGFSYYNRKEYITWINEAKTDATRQKRIDTAVEWIAEGKPRNWKYMKK
jgi:uncharacterized protein YdeI (YjbR/CyaY-like superfamily)